MFQKFAVVELLPPLTAAVVLEGVKADAMLLPGVVGVDAIPVFNVNWEWYFLPPELVEVVGTAVLLDAELELLLACESFEGDCLLLADLFDDGLNKKLLTLPTKLLVAF
jgi:hypothetical protein